MQVKILKGSSSAFVPARIPSRPTSIKAESQALPTPTADMPASSFNAAESSNMQEAEGNNASVSS